MFGIAECHMLLAGQHSNNTPAAAALLLLHCASIHCCECCCTALRTHHRLHSCLPQELQQLPAGLAHILFDWLRVRQQRQLRPCWSIHQHSPRLLNSLEQFLQQQSCETGIRFVCLHLKNRCRRCALLAGSAAISSAGQSLQEQQLLGPDLLLPLTLLPYVAPRKRL